MKTPRTISPSTMLPRPIFKKHNHQNCIKNAMVALEVFCRDNDLKLTVLRRKIFSVLLEEHRALGAYDILDRLRNAGVKILPPVVYRTLDFFISNGFAHKIERLNAFIACAHPYESHTPAFLICRLCRSVSEAPAQNAIDRLDKTATTVNFSIEHSVVEAIGLCPSCR